MLGAAVSAPILRITHTTFSKGNGVPNTTSKFFPQKLSYGLNESQKTSFPGHIFPHISGTIAPIASKKKGSPMFGLVPLREFHENWFKTANCIMIVMIIIS